MLAGFALYILLTAIILADALCIYVVATSGSVLLTSLATILTIVWLVGFLIAGAITEKG